MTDTVGPTEVALVTSSEVGDLDTDLPLLITALADAGVAADVAVWDDPAVDWAAYGVVVIRSAWDYHARLPDFLAWARRVDAVSSLWNPLALLEWNTDKRYLADLAAHGVPVVPSEFVAAGDPLPPLDGDVVVKPTVGAGSVGAARFVHDPAGARAHVAALHADGRVAMVQPYLAAVDEVGETGLVHVGGQLSHAFRKGAILAGEIHWEGGLYAREDISARVPTAEEVAVAARVMDVVGPTAYARVDLLPGADGPVVLEVELTEPSLFLHLDPAAPARAAAVFAGLRP